MLSPFEAGKPAAETAQRAREVAVCQCFHLFGAGARPQGFAEAWLRCLMLDLRGDAKSSSLEEAAE